MSQIRPYSHYYMTDDEIEEIHKKEIWNSYLAVNKDITKLPEFKQDWFKRYFPEELEKC